MLKIYIASFFLVYISSFLTIKLSLYKKMGPVFSSCITTLVLCVFVEFISKIISLDANFFFSIIFGGSFIGMTSPLLSTSLKLIFKSVLFISLYFLLITKLEGIGGTLGFLAFVSVFLVQLLSSFFSKKII